MPTLRALLPLVAIASVVSITACGGSDEPAATTAGAGAVDVVATTTIVADLARTIGGEEADVRQLLQPNSDPHDYELRPDDVLAATDAEVVLASGRGLDAWATELVEQAGGDARLVDVGADTPIVREHGGHAHEEAEHGDEDHGHEDEVGHEDEDAHAGDGHDHGDVDPHWWHDPRNVEAAVSTIRDALAAANPSARAAYEHNATAYLRRVHALDEAIAACVDEVPAARRKLVTDHDAFGYLADRYGLAVVGTVIPSLTTQAQPSAGDLAELARTIERERVTTIFTAQSVNPKLAEAIARETGARSDDSLYGDTLGPAGSDGSTYLAMEAHNADAIVRGLTDGRRGCPDALAVAGAATR